MAEINEALERKGYYFEVNQPLCDFIQHDIVQSRRAIGRPGVGGRDNNAKNPDPAHSSKSRASFLNRANSSVVTSLQHLDLYYRVNLPSRREPRMMKSVAAEILDRRTNVCTSVVVVVPHKIAGHANLLRLVSGRLEAPVL